MALSRLNRLTQEAAERHAQRIERLEADAIDEPAGAQRRTKSQRITDFTTLRHDPQRWLELIQQEQIAQSLDPWEVPRTVIEFAKARLKDIRDIES